MTRGVGPRIAGILILFAAVFVTLTVTGYTRKSATWDEPQHLTAGCMISKLHDFRVDPEHPPILRAWAALPLLSRGDLRLDNRDVGGIAPDSWVRAGQFLFAHRFLYTENDADRLLYPARFMIVLLGLLLGILLFSWARELFGFAPAAVTLGLYTLEPNTLAHSSLVTTDLGVACFIFGAVYFLWRTAREITLLNIGGLLVFCALAHVSKFSALILGPILLGLLVVTVARGEGWRFRIGKTGAISARGRRAVVAAAILVLTIVVTWGAIWAAYGFRYAPSDSASWLFRFSSDPTVCQRVPFAARLVGWIDAHRLLPNAYSQGFLLGQSSAYARGAYLAGHTSQTGWWTYFPIAFLLKTPLALLLLLSGGLALSVRRRTTFASTEGFLLVPIFLYMGVAMTARLNIGLRHILPIYPFVLVLAGSAVAWCLNTRRRAVLLALGAAWLVEFALVAPNYLTFFNLAVGGPRNGHRYLVDSNLDWGQDLKGLKRWMDRNGVRHLNLSYFGTADPAYYGIDCTYLPGAPFFVQSEIKAPRLPGYVAVSATNLHAPHLGEGGAALFKPLLDRRPVAVIGHSIHIYRVE
jgi:hypothetical protein